MILRSAVLLVFLAAISTGCSDLGARVYLRPQAEVSAISLDFGTVAVGQSARRTLTIGNSGTGALTGKATLSGAGYGFVSGGGSFTVEPGETRSVEVRFSPSAVGPFPCVLDLGPDCSTVIVTGRGGRQTQGAQCEVDPAAIDFGFVAKGQASVASFEIRNVGAEPLAVDVVSTLGPDVQISEGGGPAVIDPGDSKSVTVTFTPSSGGRIAGKVVVGSGCSDVSVDGVGTTVSFALDVYPVLRQNCASCHTFGRGVQVSYGVLVNFPEYGYGYPPYVTVKPFDLAKSVLYGKITDSGQFGSSMPAGRLLLPAHDQDAIGAWILEGASNN